MSLASRELYKHSPLPGPDHILVLIVQPARHLDDPLTCKIVFAKPGSQSKYAAISYSCATDDGDASLTCEITVEEKRLMITQNLFDGLRRLRKKKGRLRVWADALCIHQSDLEEKAQQVARIANVYRNASWTAIWLGEDSASDNTRGIFRFLKLLSTTFADREPHYPECVHPLVHGKYGKIYEASPGRCVCGCFLDSTFPTWTVEESNEFLLRCINDSQIVQKLAKRIVEIAEFVGRRYWIRQWIVQELFLSARRTLLCWRYRFRIDEDFRRHAFVMFVAVTQLRHWLSNSPLEVARGMAIDVPGSRQQVYKLSALFDYVADKSADQNLLEVLYLSEGRQCSDPRDKLYSLLSFDPDSRIFPDYTQTTAEAYTESAVDRIDHDQADWIFKTLLIQSDVRASPGDADLPSWVPDLRLQVSPPRSKSIGEGRPEITSVLNGKTLLCSLYILGTAWKYEFCDGIGTLKVRRNSCCGTHTNSYEDFVPAMASNTAIEEHTHLLRIQDESIEIEMPTWLNDLKIQSLDLVCMTSISNLDDSSLLFLRKNATETRVFQLVSIIHWAGLIEYNTGSSMDAIPWQPYPAILAID